VNSATLALVRPQSEILDIHDWLGRLGPDQWALDLGSGAGSFPDSEFACRIVALDEDPNAFTAPLRQATAGRYLRVVGRSGRVPCRDARFDLLICHHALEHIENLTESLSEMARVLKPGGRCYFAFPNGYGLCDGIYRYVFEGGGHVNRFRREAIVRELEDRLQVRLVRWQKLYSSFVYLRRLTELLEDPPPDLQKRLLAIGRLPRWTIGAAQFVLYTGTRLIDRVFGTELAVYGWAMFFERNAADRMPDGAAEQPGYVNVCPFCGAGQPAASAERRRRLACRCGTCSRLYPFCPAFGNTK
jgi:SAM-dependent methyltransferase